MFSLAFFSSKRRVDQDVASVIIRIVVSSSAVSFRYFFTNEDRLVDAKAIPLMFAS